MSFRKKKQTKKTSLVCFISKHIDIVSVPEQNKTIHRCGFYLTFHEVKPFKYTAKYWKCCIIRRLKYIVNSSQKGFPGHVLQISQNLHDISQFLFLIYAQDKKHEKRGNKIEKSLLEMNGSCVAKAHPPPCPFLF